MKTNREDGDSVDGERQLKRQKFVDSPSSSSPSPSEEKPLVPYNDDEDDERRVLNHTGGGEYGHKVESEEEDDDDPYGQGSILAKPNRQVELRRDCPYLDTVNRQVKNKL